MRRPIVLFVLLVGPAGLMAACPSSPNSAPPATPARPAVAPAQPWHQLAIAELDAAASGFARLRETRDPKIRQAALAGLLRLAIVRRDGEAAGRLLAEVPERASEPRLLVAAALAALRFGKLDERKALAARACALAEPKAVAAGRQPAVDARNVCSQLAVARAHPGRPARLCKAGCEAAQVFPLRFIGTQPVVMVGVNGGEPAPFVVDTGASTSLLTERYAKKIGVAAAPGSRWRVGSPGGMITAHRTAVSLGLGGLKLVDVPVALIALPFDGIAGLISPHDSFGQLVTTFDLRAMTMTVAPGAVTPAGDEPMVRWPLIVADGNPAVRVAVGKRPPRPLTIDTGAYKTTLSLALDRLGAPLPRAGEGRVAGAGGKGARSWATKASVAARAGDLSWTIERPTLVQRGHRGGASDVEGFGLLGMDFFMGRRLVIDIPRRQLLVSRRAVLAPWAVGDAARFEMVGSHFRGRKVTLTERVVASDGEQVTLEVSIDRSQVGSRGRVSGLTSDRFQIVIADGWASRGSWLITRPARPARPVDGDAKRLRARWVSLMASFGTTGKNPTIKMKDVELGGAKLACTETEIDAKTKKGPARFRLLECPGSPWRMTSMALLRRAGAGGGEEILWGFRRVPLP